jgi:hypothetical protein
MRRKIGQCLLAILLGLSHTMAHSDCMLREILERSALDGDSLSSGRIRQTASVTIQKPFFVSPSLR